LPPVAWDELKARQGVIMKISKMLALAAGIAGVAFSVHAQNTQNNYNTTEQAQTAPPSDYDSDLYHPCELSIDGSFVGVLHSDDFNSNGLHRKNYRFGGDAGANFFFTKYIGVGGDALAVTGHNPSFVNTAMGDLIFRVPIGDTGIAPYVFGGAGYQFEKVDQLVGGGGVGLEIRLVQHFSIFADARYLAAVKTPDYGYARAGVRLSF
jgi:hypothetical protein